jgi:hypothetical protein
MAVMNLSNNKIKEFIDQLSQDYSQFKFISGNQDHWSPKSNTITYNADEALLQLQYSVLHELSHALLDHNTYHSDFELLKLESVAWEMASKIGKKYGVKIDDEHIQNCLDTYRDWLHRRSACPTCGTHVMQKDANHYQCFNCQTRWRVSSGRFVRPYRRTLKSISH